MNNGQKIIATLAAALGAYALTAAAGAQAQRTGRATCQIIIPDGAAEGNYVVDPWPGGIVPYVFHQNVTAENQQRAIDAMAEIEAVSSVVFVPRTDEPTWIVFRSWSNNSACVGMPSTFCFVNINAWHFRFVIVHELGHVLGLWHEQQRPDRDQYVEINWDHVEPGAEINYDIMGEGHGPYDFDSVMHYDRIGFGIDLNWTVAVKDPYKRAWQRRIGMYRHLSNGDVWVLNFLYGGTLPPGAFELISPANGALVGEAWTPAFAWAESDLADSYRLLVDDDGGFGSPEIDVTVLQTTYTHGAALASNRFYYWTVMASNTIGTTDPYPFRTGSFYTGTSAPSVLHVDDDAAPGGTGASWADPMRDLQDALGLAEAAGGAVTEIRVAQGTYKPDRGSGDRMMSFDLVNGVSLLGGYAGITEPDPDVRDPGVYTSILSGDLLGDDGPGFANVEENSTSLVYAVDVDETAVLEGFQISAGNADDAWELVGGGITTDEASPVIRNCTFTDSSAQRGGGIVILFESAATVDGCLFTGNRATYVEFWPYYGGTSGALDVFHAANATIVNSEFIGNIAVRGGAAGQWGGTATYTNCLFRENTSSLGGALWNTVGSSLMEVTNSTFSGNAADKSGGAINGDGTEATVVANSVFWANSPDEIAASATVSYSDVQGGFAGTGNIDADPLFVDPLGPDGIPGTEDDDLRLSPGSPCIDAGDNTAVPVGVITDLDGNPRFVDDPNTPDCQQAPGTCGDPPVVDMGAYEFQPCPWDLDGSGDVGVTDLLSLLGQWGLDPGGPPDFDGGGVGVTDLLKLLGNWGPCPCDQCRSDKP